MSNRKRNSLNRGVERERERERFMLICVCEIGYLAWGDSQLWDCQDIRVDIETYRLTPIILAEFQDNRPTYTYELERDGFTWDTGALAMLAHLFDKNTYGRNLDGNVEGEENDSDGGDSDGGYGGDDGDTIVNNLERLVENTFNSQVDTLVYEDAVENGGSAGSDYDNARNINTQINDSGVVISVSSDSSGGTGGSLNPITSANATFNALVNGEQVTNGNLTNGELTNGIPLSHVDTDMTQSLNLDSSGAVQPPRRIRQMGRRGRSTLMNFRRPRTENLEDHAP